MFRHAVVVAAAALVLTIAVWLIRGLVLPAMGDVSADVLLVGATALLSAAVTSACWMIPILRRGRHSLRRWGKW